MDGAPLGRALAGLGPAVAPALLAVALVASGAAAADGGAACVPVGRWLEPGAEGPPPADLLRQASTASAVLLGETHASAEDHRWQLDMLARLHARAPNMVVAFEAFPRRLQPVLDRWTAGTMSEQAFLDAVDWEQVWGFPARLYLPLFHFVRRHRLPMLAMNVDRDLVARIGRDGWAAVPPAERHGIGEPAPALPGYRESLRQVFEGHAGGKDTGASFERFVAAQLTWDRAMAESIARVRRAGGLPLVVGIVGRGHVEYGFGIPHQLRDLGIEGTATLLTWREDRDCTDLVDAGGRAVADAVFGIDRAAETDGAEDGAPAAKPRLGVMIADAGDGVRIERVVDGSVAAAAGLRPGDVVRRAAGRPLSRAADLQRVVEGMLGGTLLPLEISRDGRPLSLQARFPAPEKTDAAN